MLPIECKKGHIIVPIFLRIFLYSIMMFLSIILTLFFRVSRFFSLVSFFNKPFDKYIGLKIIILKGTTIATDQLAFWYISYPLGEVQLVIGMYPLQSVFLKKVLVCNSPFILKI